MHTLPTTSANRHWIRDGTPAPAFGTCRGTSAAKAEAEQVMRARTNTNALVSEALVA